MGKNITIVVLLIAIVIAGIFLFRKPKTNDALQSEIKRLDGLRSKQRDTIVQLTDRLNEYNEIIRADSIRYNQLMEQKTKNKIVYEKELTRINSFNVDQHVQYFAGHTDCNQVK